MLQHLDFRKVIYLAEDDDDDRILFLEALRELHPEIGVEVFEDGQELLSKVNNSVCSKPEIIFLDINMPRKNGFECLKEIRRAESFFSDSKIIMFSTSSSILHIELSYKLGADFYAVKPGSFQELKELLNDIMAIDWSTTIRDKAEFLLSSRKTNTI